MANERHEKVIVTEGAGIEQRQRVVEYTPSTQSVVVSRITQIGWLFATIINLLLIFRFFFLLIAANAANGFVNLVYSLTDPLVALFNTIVPAPTLGNGGIFSIGSLIAILAYTLLIWLILSFFRTLFADPGGTRSVTTQQHVRD